MGLIRLIVIAVLLYLAWRVIKGLLANRRGDPGEPPSLSQRMVKCAHCGVHVPEAEALTDRDLPFCCGEHRRLYLDKHGQ